MKAMFGLLFYLLPMPLVFAHEHTNAVPEIDRKFLDILQRPDNRPDERFDKKSKMMLHRRGCRKSRIQDGRARRREVSGASGTCGLRRIDRTAHLVNTNG